LEILYIRIFAKFERYFTLDFYCRLEIVSIHGGGPYLFRLPLG